MEEIKVNNAVTGGLKEKIAVKKADTDKKNYAEDKASDGSGKQDNFNKKTVPDFEGEKSLEKKTLEGEIQRLKDENARQKTEFEAAIKELKIQGAVEERLHKEGARNPKLMMKLVDFSKADFDEKGALIGVDEQISSLKDSEGYLFNNDKAAYSGCFRPEEAADFSDTSKADFSLMTYSQMIKALGR